MAKRLKPVPKFRTEAVERRFWETHDTTAYFDWSKTALANSQLEALYQVDLLASAGGFAGTDQSRSQP
jgi:hypothetical protein